MKQSEAFLRSEGDGFYRRNVADLVRMEQQQGEDSILKALHSLSLRPQRVLEIGCSNGWRLDLMRSSFGAQCFGLDPSSEAIGAGTAAYPGVTLAVGTAEQLPYPAAAFDLVVFGFCLYLCDRQDLFRIAAEADRVLAARGHLAILDFSPPFPYRNQYKHHDGLYSYKMDYSRMFLWNPVYSVVSQTVFGHGGTSVVNPDDRVSVGVLRKDPDGAFIDSPYAAGSARG